MQKDHEYKNRWQFKSERKLFDWTHMFPLFFRRAG